MKEKILANTKLMFDIKERQMTISDTTVDLVFLDSMVNVDKISRLVTKPLLEMQEGKADVQTLMQEVIWSVEVEQVTESQDATTALLEGKTLLFLNDGCIAVDTKGESSRSIAEPPTSMVTKGPREGFTEAIMTNMMLLRKRIRSTDLKSQVLSVGNISKTKIAVCYLASKASSDLVKNIKKKIQQIDIEGVLDSSYVLKFLDGDKNSLFKMVGTFEKPDIVASKLLEGRVALIVDGSPIVLTLPYVFVEDLQSPDDYYYYSPRSATIARCVRLIAMVFAVLLPGIYVSLQHYNYQILPSKFLIAISAAVSGIPMPPLVEMLVIIMLFDMLREANARMPQIAGMAVSILGAIILGDAAVKAGLLGAPGVLIGALSGIGLYSMPDNTMVFTFFRLACVLIGGIMGIFGVALFAMFLIGYAVHLQDFGMAYLAPIAPANEIGKMDAIIRASFEKREATGVESWNLGKDEEQELQDWVKKDQNSAEESKKEKTKSMSDKGKASEGQS